MIYEDDTRTYEILIPTYLEVIKSESVTSKGYRLEVTLQLHHWIYYRVLINR